MSYFERASRDDSPRGPDLPTLIDRHRNNSLPDVQALALAAEAVMTAATDLHWMARRYCDGRSTYAPVLHALHTRTLLRLGLPLNPTGDGSLWADGGPELPVDGPPVGRTREAMGEEWFALWSSAEQFMESFDVLRLVKESAEAELAGLKAALAAPPGARPDPAQVSLIPGTSQHDAYLRGWRHARPDAPSPP